MTDHNDSPNLIDHPAIDQQILYSDAFVVWLLQKTIQERVVFLNEEHALRKYIHELAYGSPSQVPFMWEPNDFGCPTLPAFESPQWVESCPPSSSPNESTIPSPTFSTPETPVERWQAILEAPWRLANQQEPLDHNQRPVLMDWLKDISPANSRERSWMCQVPSTVDITQPCGEAFPRWDRALTHIRRMVLRRELVHAEILELVRSASRQGRIFTNTNTRSILSANGAARKNYAKTSGGTTSDAHPGQPRSYPLNSPTV